MQNGKHQRVNVNAHKVVRINVKNWYGRIVVKKNRSWLFNSSFWRERVVLNDDIWEKNQKNFLRPVHNFKSSEKPHFFEHITSNISKSWRDRLILISDLDSTSKITPEMIFRFPFQQQIQTHYLQTCVIDYHNFFKIEDWLLLSDFKILEAITFWRMKNKNEGFDFQAFSPFYWFSTIKINTKLYFLTKDKRPCIALKVSSWQKEISSSTLHSRGISTETCLSAFVRRDFIPSYQPSISVRTSVRHDRKKGVALSRILVFWLTSSDA